jgi:hypothetical protein
VQVISFSKNIEGVNNVFRFSIDFVKVWIKKSMTIEFVIDDDNKVLVGNSRCLKNNDLDVIISPRIMIFTANYCFVNHSDM